MMDRGLSNKIANMCFLCTLLVVVIHSPLPVSRELNFWEHFVKEVLTMIAVPTFFVISGYLLALRMPRSLAGGIAWWLDAMKKRVRTIWVPYVVLSLLWFPVKYSFHWIGVRNFGADATAEVMSISVQNFLSGAGILPWGHSVVVGF